MGLRLTDPLTLLLAPAACELCACPLRASTWRSWRLPVAVCGECLARLRRDAREPAWSADGLPGRALFWYEGPLAGWIRGVKEGRRPGLLRELAAGWPDPPLPLPARARLVPVPADPVRRRARGGDPVDELARHWARAWGMTTVQPLVRRTGRKQQGLAAADRRLNLAEQYRLARAKARDAAGPVVLVDDVATTGATLAVCRDRLEAGGWQVAALLALACTPRPDLRLSRLDGAIAGEVHDGGGASR